MKGEEESEALGSSISVVFLFFSEHIQFRRAVGVALIIVYLVTVL
jgi:hypothetical protein